MSNHDQISSLRFALNVWHDASMLMSGVTPVAVEKPECRGSCTGVTVTSCDRSYSHSFLRCRVHVSLPDAAVLEASFTTLATCAWQPVVEAVITMYCSYTITV